SPRMRNIPLSTAALMAGLGMSLGASAQPQIMFYGQLDSYVEVFDNGEKTTARVSSGGANGSFFGLRGSEELGNGLRAVFRLEGGFLSDDGTLTESSQHLFSRMAYLGLAGKAGQISVGRQHTPLFMTVAAGRPVGMSIGNPVSYFFVPKGINGGNAEDRFARRDNSIQYETPRGSGLQGTAFVALGEKLESNRIGNVYSLGLSYQKGPIEVRASYLREETTWIANNTDRYLALSASYELGFIKPAAILVKRSGSAAQAQDIDYWQMGASIPLIGGQLITNVGFLSNDTLADSNAMAWGMR
ncbi:MAG: porin, partial [Burkholderiaceae bacterium]